MLEVRNYDGLLTFLFGMIILVFAAITFSLLADRFSDSVQADSRLRFELRRQQEEIRVLRYELELAKSRRGDHEDSLASDIEKARLIELRHDAVVSRLAHLYRLRAELDASVSEIGRSFRDYRVEARENAWARAVGDSLGDLRTSDGRVFREAVILLVNETSVSIRHASGTSSISARALPDAYRERFQWEKPLRHTADAAITAGVPTGSGDDFLAEDESRSDAPGGLDLLTRRSALRRAGEAVERLTGELETISSMEKRSDSRSVPGSLDTWAERKAKTGKSLARARMRYAKARADLKIHSPNDALLGIWRMPWTSSLR